MRCLFADDLCLWVEDRNSELHVNAAGLKC